MSLPLPTPTLHGNQFLLVSSQISCSYLLIFLACLGKQMSTRINAQYSWILSCTLFLQMCFQAKFSHIVCRFFGKICSIYMYKVMLRFATTLWFNKSAYHLKLQVNRADASLENSCRYI